LLSYAIIAAIIFAIIAYFAYFQMLSAVYFRRADASALRHYFRIFADATLLLLFLFA